jgi:hypothetical protein
VVGLSPFSLNARRSARPPPPICSMNGIPRSWSIAHSGWKSACVGDFAPGIEFTSIAPHPASSAASASAQVRSPHGTEPTAIRRWSAEQKSAIARFSARVPPHRSSASLPRNWENANVGKTSCRSTPIRSSARLRSPGSNAPSASHPLAVITFASSLTVACGSAARALACAMSSAALAPAPPR